MIKFVWLCFVSLTLTLELALASDPTGDHEFDFYFGEIIQQELPDDDPMRDLIEDGLVAAVFNASDDYDFKRRLKLIQSLADRYPEKIESLWSLDRKLSEAFEERLSEAKRKRLIYSASGAVIGLVIAIPAGKMISGSWKSLWISIPVGAASGAGLGFLLGQLTLFPEYAYESGMIESDLDFELEEIDLLMSEL